MATHLVTALGNDSHNPANDAVQQVLSAAASRKQVYLDTQYRNVHKPRAVIVIAVVVITGPLYECHLSSKGQMDLKPTPSVQLGYRRAEGKDSRVWVLREEALPQFAYDLMHRCNDAASGLAGE